MYSKGGRGILSVIVQQGWERDSLCKCTARVGEGFSLVEYSKGGRGILSVREMYRKTGRTILSVSVKQELERESLCECIERMGEDFSAVYSKGGRGTLSVSVQQGWERDSLCKFLEREGE